MSYDAVHNAGHYIRRSAPTRIQRSRAKGSRLPLRTLCVTRPGIYGNPFHVETFGRTCAVEMFREHLRSDPGLEWTARRALSRTIGAYDHVACWCRPELPCHADVWIEAFEGCWWEIDCAPSRFHLRVAHDTYRGSQ